MYNATALLETRLSYIQSMLDKYQKQQRSVVAALTGAHVEPSANSGQQLEAPDSLRERIENLAESAAQFMASGVHWLSSRGGGGGGIWIFEWGCSR